MLLLHERIHLRNAVDLFEIYIDKNLQGNYIVTLTKQTLTRKPVFGFTQ